jgi:MFS family permease
VGSSPYRDLLRLRAVRWEALTGLVAQVTQGAAAVGIILVVRAHTGSLALAGGVVGVLSIAAGIARPVQGRLIDRRGASALMALCGVIHPAALIAIVALAHARAPGVSLLAFGAIAGLALPPVSTSMRVVWGEVLPAGDRTAAYSLVYLTQELSVLTGPLVLSAVIALASASLAVIAVAALAGVGTLGFAALLARRPSPSISGSPRGVFRVPAMRVLIAVAVLTGGVIGALEVAAPTAAAAHHAPAASGLLIAALSVGGIIGAAIYGGRRWLAAPSVRLPLLLAALTAAMAATVAVSGLFALGCLMIAGGLAFNPSLTTISVLVDDHVTRPSAAEAFGWLSLGIAGGTGAASAIAGALTRPAHPRTAFIVAALAGAAAALLAAAARGTLRRAHRQLL